MTGEDGRESAKQRAVKITSFLLIGVLLLVSCGPKVLPLQVVEGDMPVVTPLEEDLREIRASTRNSSRPKKRRAELTDKEKGWLMVGAAVIGLWGYHKLAGNQRGCGDCGADGRIHRGDPAHRHYRVKVGRECPKCRGYGYH